ncbi:AMP-binding enzyme [Nocardioides insulae]|uniref:AMP-binding enzyme n=1 Tax=Nocardioides insulae TaxID=394734 RepID=UPI000419D6E8|nr:AMP-binding protein [Nocardioides insulae]
MDEISIAPRQHWVRSNAAATAEAFTGGWFRSGDLVRVDGEGIVYVADRAKDTIISCGEVENVLSGPPGLAEISVIGRDDERLGETPAAVVVPADGAELELEELRAWGSGQLARCKLPTVLEIVPELPRNPLGKVTNDAMRERSGAPA